MAPTQPALTTPTPLTRLTLVSTLTALALQETPQVQAASVLDSTAQALALTRVPTAPPVQD